MTQSLINKALLEIDGKSLRTQIKHICGEELNYGLFRDVYVFKQDRRFVVKVERDMSTGNYANVTEWRNWINYESWTKLSSWLARCTSITESGQILIQRRVYHFKNREYPIEIPSLFTDTKKSNFGWIGKQFVCCDYSFMLNTNFRMKKAKWWNLN